MGEEIILEALTALIDANDFTDLHGGYRPAAGVIAEQYVVLVDRTNGDHHIPNVYQLSDVLEAYRKQVAIEDDYDSDEAPYEHWFELKEVEGVVWHE